VLFRSAVLVGVGTVLADDPQLTVRLPRARGRAGAASQPLRVILDGHLRTPVTAQVLRGPAPTLIVTARGASPVRARRLRAAGAEVLELPARQGRVTPGALLRALAARHMQSVLVEGGATVHGAFVAAGVVDRVAIFLAPSLLGHGIPIARGAGLPLADALGLGPLTTLALGHDVLLTADVIGSF
jgi:diaminohydroxyphosphoribosylaminopyrimidine deaminase/5-amino-6-(5-phosphoribosylamino)uracil reductase